MYRSVTAVVIAGRLLVSGSTPAVSTTVPLADSPAAASSCTTKRPKSSVRLRIARKTHRLVNEQRRQNGVAALEVDPGVTNAATKHSNNMARTGTFSHVIDGKGPADRLRDENISFTAYDENIYSSWCQKSGRSAYDVHDFAQEAVSGWMNSPGHRANILNPDFTHTGIGIAAIARDGKGYLYATQVFIRR